ncbi:MAG: peptide deformylase [Actinobacteria bacterium]|nr:MAG: peptide deformylase [Actinomycetota bacterium]
MAMYPVRTFPDPVLSMSASIVSVFDDDLSRLVEDMVETMYEAPGVGLAAPQIGVLKRVFVADIGDGPFAMVNPQIVETSGRWKFEEGCLSVPDRFWLIKRADYARAEGVGVDGMPVMFEGDELLGRVLQHEIDHLDGTLLLARLSTRVRKQVLKELREESLGSKRIP